MELGCIHPYIYTLRRDVSSRSLSSPVVPSLALFFRVFRLYNARIWPTFLFIGSHGKMSRCRFLFSSPPSASTSLHFRVSCSRVFFPLLLFFAFLRPPLPPASSSSPFGLFFPFPFSSSLASSSSACSPEVLFSRVILVRIVRVPRIPTLSLSP